MEAQLQRLYIQSSATYAQHALEIRDVYVYQGDLGWYLLLCMSVEKAVLISIGPAAQVSAAAERDS